MTDLRRLAFFAVLFIVIVRMAIGWQLFYEGVWKIDTQDTAKPWTSAGYLKNAQGPLREQFRSLVDDPDDENWLNYDTVSKRWDDWSERFSEHYELDANQKRRLKITIDGPPRFYGSVKIAELPPGVESTDKGLKKAGDAKAKPFTAITFDKANSRLVVEGNRHLIPREQAAILKLAPLIENPQTDDEKRRAAVVTTFREAVDDAFQRSSRLSFRERLIVKLKADPDKATTKLRRPESGRTERLGDIDLYRQLVDRYERKLAGAETAFMYEHLKYDTRKVQEKKSAVVPPVQALETELKWRSRRLLTEEQLAIGPLKEPRPRHWWVDWSTMLGLLILGLMLIVGFATRLAAFLGAGMVLMFYLAMPPFPWLPPAPGPEHSMYINKNLIEVFALLAIACMPTGQWFGVDAWLKWFFVDRRKTRAWQERRQARKTQSKPASKSKAEAAAASLDAAPPEPEPVAAESKQTEPAKDTYTLKK